MKFLVRSQVELMHIAAVYEPQCQVPKNSQIWTEETYRRSLLFTNRIG